MRRVFFRYITERRWKDAEVTLEKMQTCNTENGEEWIKGHLNAFNGMLIGLRKTHTHPEPLILQMTTASFPRLQELKKRFDAASQRRLNAAFDQGFYRSWAEYLDFLVVTHVHKRAQVEKSDG
jgi:hypothetical protein